MPAKTTTEETAAPALEQFVVLVGAVTIGTGVKKPNGREEVVRVNQGGTINADPANESIQTLLAGKGIAKIVEGQVNRPATVKAIVKAMGADDDAVIAPETQPIAPQPADLAAATN